MDNDVMYTIGDHAIRKPLLGWQSPDGCVGLSGDLPGMQAEAAERQHAQYQDHSRAA